MEWQDTAEEAAFRAQVREFLATELPERYRTLASHNRIVRRVWQKDRLSSEPGRRDTARRWAAALARRGWFAPHWPREYGGAGLGPAEQFVFNEEMARVDAPSVQGVGVGFLGSALIIHGTDEAEADPTCPASSTDRWCGRRASRSRAPAPISPVSRRAPCGTAMSTS